MDEPRYPPPKRRRTSSDSPSRSPSPSSSLRRSHHAPPSDRRDGRSYPADSRSRSYSTSPSRSRSPPHRQSSRSPSPPPPRRRRSESASSNYSSARSHHSTPRRQSEGSWREDTRPPSRTGTPPTPPRKTLNFAPLYTIPKAHARGITTVKFSPDMNFLATASADNTINIYSVGGVVPAHATTAATTTTGTADTTTTTASTTDTTTNATATATATTTSETGPWKLVRTLRGHLAGINQIAWSPSGPPYTLASASDDKSILLWSPLSSDFPIAPSPLLGHSNYVYSLAFSPKGNMLVSGSHDEAVFLWDVRSARIMRSLPAHSDPVSGVDFLLDGSMVVSCAGDGLIRIWDASTGQCLKTLVDEERRGVGSVRFSPNGRYVVSWGVDGCVRLWRYGEGRCVKTYTGHRNVRYSLSGVVGDYWFAGSRGAFLASGSEDGDVVVWDVVSKDVLWRGGAGHTDVVLALDFGRDAEGRGLLVSVGKDRDVRVWALEEGEKGREMDDDVQMQMEMQMEMELEMEAHGVVHDMHHGGGGGGRGRGGDNDGDVDRDGGRDRGIDTLDMEVDTPAA